MKTLIPFLILSLFLLGSCTETIIDEIIKLDTVYVSTPRSVAATVIVQYDTVVIRDTVKVEVVVHDTVINNIHTTDTLIQVVTKDSIIIKEVEKLVTIYDTIFQVVNNYDTIVEYVTDTVEIEVVRVEQRVIYHDTLYVVGVIRQVTSIPDELLPHVEYFYTQAAQYGKTTIGGNMIIHYVKQKDLPGEGWTSNSFNLQDFYSGQMVIQISEEVPHEQARSCILRELSRLQLNKQYVTDVNKIMSPLFPITTVITIDHLNELFANPI